MIHIKKSKAGYRCVYIGRNGEILATSEVLTSKQNAWKNVRAMVRLHNGYATVVLDAETDTRYLVRHTGKPIKQPK